MKNYRTKITSNSEEHENDELWAISYGDMITLLLSFFVIFFSTDFKKEKINNININLIKNLNNNETKVSSEIMFKIKNSKITTMDGVLYISFNNQMFFKKGEINHIKNVLKLYLIIL